MAARRHIAVLFHRAHRGRDLSQYLVHHLAGLWRERGHRVTYLFGTREFVPADLVFVHVDLSVVPEEYLAFAARYPRSVNGRVRDIRKSSFSRNLVRPGDDWAGPVIVKTDLNCAGRPERMLAQPTWIHRHRATARAERWWHRHVRHLPFDDSAGYPVYPDLEAVPERLSRDPRLVVERFLPEVEGALYRVRLYQFLGSRWTCIRLASPDPAVNIGSSVETEPVPPHPDIVRRRHELGLDFGKLDHVVVEGEAHLLDVNKTTGAIPPPVSAATMESRRHRAAGIGDFLGGS